MLAAVELVGDREARWRASLQTANAPLRAVAFSDPRLSNTSQDAEEVQSGFLKITQRAMVKSRSMVNIAVCLCLHSSLTYHRNINRFECSTMWVGRQSRRVCFGAKPDKGFLDMKSRRIRKWEGDAKGSWRRDPAEGSWRLDSREGSWRLDSREANSRGWRGSTDRGGQHQTPEQRGKAAWDRVQREWVKMSLIPVALWNFR